MNKSKYYTQTVKRKILLVSHLLDKVYAVKSARLYVNVRIFNQYALPLFVGNFNIQDPSSDILSPAEISGFPHLLSGKIG